MTPSKDIHTKITDNYVQLIKLPPKWLIFNT